MSPPNETNKTQEMTSLQRVIVGCLGGLAAILVKYVSRDHDTLMVLIGNTNPEYANYVADGIRKMSYSYMMLTPILIFLGGIIGWISDENSRYKLFFLGISAPGLITTWEAGKIASQSKQTDYRIVNSAFAAPVSDSIGPQPNLEIQLAQFGGYSADSPIYLVQAGAFLDREKASQVADRINAGETIARAFVSEFRNADQSYVYRVIIAQGLSLKDALLMKSKIDSSGITKDSLIRQIKTLSSGATN